MIEWKVDISKIFGAALERAKIECGRRQCELIEQQNELLKKIIDAMSTK